MQAASAHNNSKDDATCRMVCLIYVSSHKQIFFLVRERLFTTVVLFEDE